MAESAATEFTQNLMASHPDIQEFLDELVVFEAHHLRMDVPNLRHDAAVSCGISLVRPGRAVTVASSDGFAERLGQVQYDVDDGPCLQALHSGVAQLAPDLEGGDPLATVSRGSPAPGSAVSDGAAASARARCPRGHECVLHHTQCFR